MSTEHRISSVFPFSGQSSKTVAQGITPVSDRKSTELLVNTDNLNPLVLYGIDWIRSSNLPWPEKFLLSLMLQNSLRVSEICNPFDIDKIGEDRVSLFSSKQQLYKVCLIPQGMDYVNEPWKLEVIRNWKRSRQYYYRILNMVFFNVKSQRKYNQSICHAARNLNAQEIFERTRDIKDVMQTLGVSEQKSAEHYLTYEQLKELKSNL